MFVTARVTRLAALALITVLAVTGCGGGAAAPARSDVKISGTGSDRSALVQLNGNYGVTWSLSARPTKCLAILTLESPTDKAVLEVIADDEAATSGTTNIYSLEQGGYFIDGELNDCGPWTVVLTPS